MGGVGLGVRVEVRERRKGCYMERTWVEAVWVEIREGQAMVGLKA